MNRNFIRRTLALTLALVLMLGIAACGEKDGSVASTAQLLRTEGRVEVTDSEGKVVKLIDAMRLYSGYTITTLSDGYSWMELDSTKQAKLDASSEAEIKQDGKDFEITLNRGRLFFKVEEPLGDDESWEIRFSTMIIRIIDACGWVELTDSGHMRVYVLKGKVECSVRQRGSLQRTRETVSAGQMAELVSDGDDQHITTGGLAATDIPEFVEREMEEDPTLADLAQDLEKDSSFAAGESHDPAILDRVDYFGDSERSAMTADQAEQLYYALLQAKADIERTNNEFGYDWGADGVSSYAQLFDAGNGMPGMIFAGGAYALLNGYEYMMAPYSFAIWHFPNGEIAEFTDFDMAYIYEGWIVTDGYWPDGSGYSGEVHPLVGYIADEASTFAEADFYFDPAPTFAIDGAAVTEPEFSAWTVEWNPVSDLGVSHGSDISASHWGMVPAEEILGALMAWAGLGEPENTPPEVEDEPVLDVQPSYEIRHVDMDNDGYDVEIFYEYPVFEEISPAFGIINQYWEDRAKEFFSGASMESAWDIIGEYGVEYGPYFYRVTAEDIQLGREYVSVYLYRDWYMGGNGVDVGAVCGVFSTVTGEVLLLTDVIDASEQEIKDMIVTELRVLDSDGGWIWFEYLKDYSIRDFDFYIEDGVVHVEFDKYEIATGAAGIVDIALPATLKII